MAVKLDYEAHLLDRTRLGAASAERNIAGIGGQARKTEGMLGGLGSGGAASLGKIGPAAAAGAAAVVAIGAAAIKAGQAFGQMINRITSANRELLFLSESSGIGVEALSVWSIGMEELGGSADDAAMAIREVSAHIGETWVAMQEGGTGGEPGEALRALNLDLQELLKLDPEAQLRRVVNALNAEGNQAIRSALANQILSDQYAEMLPMLSRVAGSYDEIAAHARDSGRLITREQAEASAEAQQSWSRFIDYFRGIAQTVTAEILPSLTTLLESMASPAKFVAEVVDNVTGVVGRILGGIGRIIGDRSGREGILGLAGGFDAFKVGWQTGWSQIETVFAQAEDPMGERFARFEKLFTSAGVEYEGFVGKVKGGTEGDYKTATGLLGSLTSDAVGAVSDYLGLLGQVWSGALTVVGGLVSGNTRIVQVGLLELGEANVNAWIGLAEFAARSLGKIGASMAGVIADLVHGLSQIEFTVSWPQISQPRGMWSVPQLEFGERTFKPFGGLAGAATNLGTIAAVGADAAENISFGRVSFGQDARAALNTDAIRSLFDPTADPSLRDYGRALFGDDVFRLQWQLASGLGGGALAPGAGTTPGTRTGPPLPAALPTGTTVQNAYNIFFNGPVVGDADFQDRVEKAVNTALTRQGGRVL